jgi:3-oxoacyl-[acyl-carrier protein] reductase
MSKALRSASQAFRAADRRTGGRAALSSRVEGRRAAQAAAGQPGRVQAQPGFFFVPASGDAESLRRGRRAVHNRRRRQGHGASGLNQLDFGGRVAIVTGGAQGIGLAIVRRLLASHATVRIWDRDADRLGKALGELAGPVNSIAVDVADPAAVAAAADTAVRDLGRIDVLVNNAGVAGLNAPTVDYPVEEWERVLKVNLTSQFLCCRAVAPHMVKAKYGRIVNVASIAGKEGNPNAVAYSASKAGVIALTKSLGKELAKSGVTVNCVTPAAARTAIFEQMSQSHIDYMLAKIPMGRFVKVEEVAALACWLASEECSFSTGAVFDVSGGRATY